MIKDIFITNMHENFQNVREKLLLEDELTLEKARSLSQSIVSARSHATEFKESTNIFYQSQSSNQSSSQSSARSRNRSQSHQRRSQSRPRSSQSQDKANCTRCGQIHRFRCPASNARCRKCHVLGHYEAFCRSKTVKFVEVENNKDYEGNESNYLFVGHLNSSLATAEWNVNFVINSVEVQCVLDTGSDANVMSYNVFQSLNSHQKLSPCHAKVTSYCGNSIPILGQQILECTYYINNQPQSKNVNFIIANVSSPTVIGKNTCSELGLIKRVFNIEKSNDCQSLDQNYESNLVCSHSHSSEFNNCLVNNNNCQSQSYKSNSEVQSQSYENNSHVQSKLQSYCINKNNTLQSLLYKFKSVFDGLGCLPGECHITVNKDVRPKIDPPRKIPFSLYDRLKKELDNMESLDVITKVTEPTSWVSSLLLVEKKNGQLRVCLDPRNLNEAICRSHYPIPTIDMVRSKLHGASYFSTLDASSGFWVIRLDTESSMLCTFNTPFGRYRFKRLPFGINCAPEIFHRIMTETFGVLPGVMVYADDILVYGKDRQEHDENLKRVFKKAQDVNLKFNKSKCKFGHTQIKYLGHIFSKNGVSPDPDKVRAIKDMPSPVCLKDLQRFLGILNYLGGFIKNLAEETEPLRLLLKKSSEWSWNESHEATFSRLKNIICQAPVLSHYNVKKSVVLSVDSSQSAVGAVLLQENHPICYASKTLTSSQKCMAQIEKELYAIVFGCIRFHQYIYGKIVTVETDHRPLITLFKKPLAEVPTRLQRLMLRIQAYDLKVEYKPGTKMYIADSLSRAALPESSEDELDEDVIIHVNMLVNNLPISEERLKWLTEATENDECLQLLKRYYREGWPDRKSQVNKLVLPYWNCRHEIHSVGKLLLRSNSLIIPTKLRSEILKMIHSGHQGIEKSKNFARGVVYWPLMSHDIKQSVENCETCLSHRSANQPEPLMPHKISSFPWEKVGIDYLKFKNQTILVVEDYYSNYIEIANVSSTGAKALINVLKSIFSRHGIPVLIFSDNGPPYNSQEFKQFLESWSITHRTSSPYLSRSNGLVESGVKIVKRILTKCAESGEDPYLALLQYRTTPRNNLPSPAELLMSRRLRTLIPTVGKHLQPRVMSYKNYRKIKQQNIDKQKFYYDRKSKNLPKVKKGDKIMFKKSPESKWQPGKIVKECEEPRSFIVETPDGSTYRRNRQHLSSYHSSPSKEIQEKKVLSPVQSQYVSPKKEMKMEEYTKQSPVEEVKRTLRGRQVKAPVRFQDCMYD